MPYELGKDAFVYTPAELGFNAVNVASGGTIVSGLAVQLMDLYPWTHISIIRELGAGSGTPGNLLQQSIGLGSVQWSDGLINSSLWAAITNGPRTQFAHYTRGQTTATLTTGTVAPGEFAKLWGSPSIRLAYQNLDAAVAQVVTLTMILKR